MSTAEAIDILEKYNAWRRDKSVPASSEMQSPILIGQAIDKLIEDVKKKTYKHIIPSVADIENAMDIFSEKKQGSGWNTGLKGVKNHFKAGAFWAMSFISDRLYGG